MTRMRKEIRPHSTDARVLEKSAAIYQKGQTPEVDAQGRVTALRVAPYGPGKTAQQLGEVQAHFGAQGVQQTIAGLHRTRGNQFMSQMVRQNGTARRMISGQAVRRAASDGEETERKQAASDVRHRTRSPRLQRAINFSVAKGTVTTSNMSVDEKAAGWRPQSRVRTDTFIWTPDVTIRGNAGDPFSDWETAHHQVCKSYHENAWWGSGANRTHRKWRVDGGLPIRDATARGNTWYSDWRAQGFATNGEVKSPVLRDGPFSIRYPWNNPTSGRTGNRGWFNFSHGFVGTVSARHKPTGTGAAAFRHLGTRHWNFGIGGSFNAARPVGSRVSITTGGRINYGGMFRGHDRNFPPMHGGDILNDKYAFTDT